jgi:hypothetical protein
MTSTQPCVVMGEVTALGTPSPLACDIPGVVRAQQSRRGKGFRVEERLYECANGLALGARRGGPLHLADADSWEVFTLDERRLPIGGHAVGWIGEEQLLRLVKRLAEWPWEAAS